MTSKEALEKICLHCEHYHQNMCFRAIAGCEEWHKLEKDLEILEILKEVITNNVFEVGMLDASSQEGETWLSCEDFGITLKNIYYYKIRRWLNEK